MGCMYLLYLFAVASGCVRLDRYTWVILTFFLSIIYVEGRGWKG